VNLQWTRGKPTVSTSAGAFLCGVPHVSMHVPGFIMLRCAVLANLPNGQVSATNRAAIMAFT
jgi:hypothetical protein